MLESDSECCLKEEGNRSPNQSRALIKRVRLWMQMKIMQVSKKTIDDRRKYFTSRFSPLPSYVSLFSHVTEQHFNRRVFVTIFTIMRTTVLCLDFHVFY